MALLCKGPAGVSLVTVCGSVSSLTQVTVVPTLTVNEPGSKASWSVMWMVGAAGPLVHPAKGKRTSAARASKVRMGPARPGWIAKACWHNPWPPLAQTLAATPLLVLEHAHGAIGQ